MDSRKKKTKKVKKFKLIVLILVLIIANLLFSFVQNSNNANLNGLSVQRWRLLGYPEDLQNVEENGIRSISMESSANYENQTPGSWHLEKSAEWTDKGKAKITFDVSSILKKPNNNYKDVILVLDISGSMEGDKLRRVKEDSIELVESLLSDSNNKVGLVVYDTNAETITGFTNDKADLVSRINALSDKGCTNYNDPLKHVNAIMENYVKQDNRDVVTLFLTDGYPNEDIPNQIATYEMLKSKYPYMAINGIQYEMGAQMTQEIIEISDAQFIASMETLENVLFEASLSPMVYEKFEVQDVINNDYFVVGTVDDIKVTRGTVNLTEEDGKQKITWNLDNTNTGIHAYMYIDVTLKNEYVSQDGNYPTNKGTKVTEKLDENEEEKVTTSTPILVWKKYSVIYDGNAPEGKEVNGVPAIEQYYQFDTVTKKQTEPNCEGWNFKGWEISTENVTKVNEDKFIMPAKDVTIKAEWGKTSIVKSMEGEVTDAGQLVKYAVQIYGIQQDVDEDDNPLGLTFGPATGASYKDSYVTHTYEETSSGSKEYYVKIVTHNVNTDGTETTTEDYLYKNGGTTEKVTRTEAEKNKYDINIHDMKWKEIKQQSEQDPTVFLDCMLCGDTKSVNIYLNEKIAASSNLNLSQRGDGAGMLYTSINFYYRKWNPSSSDNRAATNGGSRGSNAQNAGGYSTSHIRATLIGKEKSNPDITYAGDDNLSEDECLYSCIESGLKKVITAKKVKYVTGTNYTTGNYQTNNTPLLDKIWLFSDREIYGTGEYSGNTTEGIGTTGVGYNKFANTESRYYLSSYSSNTTENRNCYYEAGSDGSGWWLRSPNLNDANSVRFVRSIGVVRNISASNGDGLSLGFCIK